MTARAELLKEIDKLPQKYYAEVFDFLEYLQQKKQNILEDDVAGYKAMAADAEREQEAHQWCNAYFGRVSPWHEAVFGGLNSILLLDSEINKTRPAVIVSNDIANKFLARVVVIPLTSNVSRVYPGEAVVTINGNKNKAMTDQIMSADKSRLKNKIAELSDNDLISIETAMKRFLDLI